MVNIFATRLCTVPFETRIGSLGLVLLNAHVTDTAKNNSKLDFSTELSFLTKEPVLRRMGNENSSPRHEEEERQHRSEAPSNRCRSFSSEATDEASSWLNQRTTSADSHDTIGSDDMEGNRPKRPPRSSPTSRRRMKYFDGGSLKGNIAAIHNESKTGFVDPILAAAAVGAETRKSKHGHILKQRQLQRQHEEQQRIKEKNRVENEWKSSLQLLASAAASTATRVAHAAGPVFTDATTVIHTSAKEFAQDLQIEWNKEDEPVFEHEEESVQLFLPTTPLDKSWLTTPSENLDLSPSASPNQALRLVRTFDDSILSTFQQSGSSSEGIRFDLFPHHSSAPSLLPLPQNAVTAAEKSSSEACEAAADSTIQQSGSSSEGIRSELFPHHSSGPSLSSLPENAVTVPEKSSSQACEAAANSDPTRMDDVDSTLAEKQSMDDANTLPRENEIQVQVTHSRNNNDQETNPQQNENQDVFGNSEPPSTLAPSEPPSISTMQNVIHETQSSNAVEHKESLTSSNHNDSIAATRLVFQQPGSPLEGISSDLFPHHSSGPSLSSLPENAVTAPDKWSSDESEAATDPDPTRMNDFDSTLAEKQSMNNANTLPRENEIQVQATHSKNNEDQETDPRQNENQDAVGNSEPPFTLAPSEPPSISTLQNVIHETQSQNTVEHKESSISLNHNDSIAATSVVGGISKEGSRDQHLSPTLKASRVGMDVPISLPNVEQQGTHSSDTKPTLQASEEMRPLFDINDKLVYEAVIDRNNTFDLKKSTVPSPSHHEAMLPDAFDLLKRPKDLLNLIISKAPSYGIALKLERDESGLADDFGRISDEVCRSVFDDEVMAMSSSRSASSSMSPPEIPPPLSSNDNPDPSREIDIGEAVLWDLYPPKQHVMPRKDSIFMPGNTNLEEKQPDRLVTLSEPEGGSNSLNECRILLGTPKNAVSESILSNPIPRSPRRQTRRPRKSWQKALLDAQNASENFASGPSDEEEVGAIDDGAAEAGQELEVPTVKWENEEEVGAIDDGAAEVGQELEVLTVKWENEDSGIFPGVPDTEDISEAYERGGEFDEALLAFSSLDDVRFLRKMDIFSITEPDVPTTFLPWRLLLASWKHAEIWKAMIASPCTMRFRSFQDLSDEFDTDSLSSTSASTSKILYHETKVDFLGCKSSDNDLYLAIRDISGFSPQTLYGDVNALTGYICDIGPTSFNNDVVRNNAKHEDSGCMQQQLPVKNPEAKEAPDEIAELLRFAEESQTKLDDIVRNIVQFSSRKDLLVSDFDETSIFYSVGVKTYSSTKKKAARKYGGDVTRVLDLLRAQIIFPDEGSLVCGLVKLWSFTESTSNREAGIDRPDIKILRLKNLFRTSPARNAYLSALPTGYRHILINIRLGTGIVAELQFQLSQFYQVLGPAGYELHNALVSGNGQDTKPLTDGIDVIKFTREILDNIPSVSMSILKKAPSPDASASEVSPIAVGRGLTADFTEVPKQIQAAGAGGIAAMAATAATKEDKTAETGGGGIAAMAAAAAKMKQKNMDGAAGAGDIAAMAAAGATQKNKADETNSTAAPGGGGIAAMAAAAAKMKQKNMDGAAGAGDIAAMAAAGATQKNKADETNSTAAPGGGGIAAMAAAAAAAKMKKKNMDGAAGAGGIAAMAAAAAAQKNKADETNSTAAPGGGGIAAMAAAAAAAKMKKKNMVGAAGAGGIAAMAAAAAAQKNKADGTAPQGRGGFAAMAAAAAKKNIGGAAGAGGIAAIAAAAAAKKNIVADTNSKCAPGRGGVAAMAAAAGAEQRAKIPGSGPAAIAAAAAAAEMKNGASGSEPAVGSGDANQHNEVELIVATMKIGALEAHASPRDFSSFYCLYLLARRLDGSTLLGKTKSTSNIKVKEIKTVAKRLLLRSLAISNQATSVGMVGWLEYGSSNPLERTLSLPFEVLRQLSCNLASDGEWDSATDVLGSLVLRCEQLLPPYDPTALSAMLDLSAASSMAGNDVLARGLITRASDFLSLYLSQHERLFFEKHQALAKFERHCDQVVYFDDGEDIIALLEAFATSFLGQLSRDFLRIVPPDHEIRLFNHSFVADSLAVLANCLSAGEERYSDPKPKNKKGKDECASSKGCRYYWTLAYEHYQHALRGWLRVSSLTHPNTASTAYSVARSLRELGMLDQALKILTTLASALQENLLNSKMLSPNIPLRTSILMPPTLRNGRMYPPAFSLSESCRNEQTLVLGLWLMAVLTVEQSPDERGRIRALSLLHSASDALRRIIGNLKDLDEATKTICLEMYGCIEQEARILFEPLQLIPMPRPHKTRSEAEEKDSVDDLVSPMRQKRWFSETKRQGLPRPMQRPGFPTPPDIEREESHRKPIIHLI